MTDMFARLTGQYDDFKRELEQLSDEDVLEGSQELLAKIRQDSESIVDPGHRSILSSLARGLGDIIFDISGIYPPVRLASPAAFVGRPNRFIYGRPVHPDEFVNREDALRAIFNRLRYGQSTAVTGQPHIGKSSMLLKLADKATQRDYLGGDAQGMSVSVHDLHDIDGDYSPAAFWEEALGPLHGQPDRTLLARCLEKITQTGYASDSMVRLLDYLYERGHKLVLLLDEFERLLCHPNFQSFAFFATLRTLDTWSSFSFVIASRLSLPELNWRGNELPGSGGSPLFNTLVEEPLGAFEDRAVNTLLGKAGDALTRSDRYFICRVAGREPFLVQAMAAAMVETTGPGQHVRACERFYEWISYHFDDVWQTLEDRMRTMLIVICLVELGGRSLGSDFDYSELQQVDALGSALSRLDRLGLAERVEETELPGVQYALHWGTEWWAIGAQALAWWVRDVVVAEVRKVPSYDEWLADKRYRSLLAHEQWDHLVSQVRGASGLATREIGALAQELFVELIKGD